MIGQTISHYRIISELGAGGMGVVYLAEDVRLHRSVAVKILPAEVAEDEGRRARFAREARLASALNHPHIAHVYDVGEDGGTHFIAMEYVEGPDLGEQLASTRLDQDRILDIGSQVAGALEEARLKGIIHRDIKPANIALTSRGEVKVLDFGLAKLTEGMELAPDDPTLVMSRPDAGTVAGTVRYMSPEQALGKELDTRSDLFSLGVVLYEMVAGRPPFAGSTTAAVYDAIVHQPPEALAPARADLSPELERIIRKCLEKDPANRYQTPLELLVDLRNLRRARDSGIAITARPPARPAARRRRWLLPAALVVVVAAVSAAYFLAPRARADVRALAVLPFENATGDPEIDYLCNGVTESLINTLAQVPELKVISSRSAFAMRGRSDDPRAAGRELGVDAILFGRVVQHDDEMMISTELVQTRDSRQLWGARYNRPVSQIQAVENEITTTIASMLRAKLTGGGDVVTRHETDDPEAYRLYLKGREFTVGTRREMDKAIEYYQEAIARDPDYALAYAGLAQCYTSQSYLRGSERDDRVELARAAAAKALELDPDLAEAYTAAGLIKMMFDLDWRGAEADLRRAVALGPNGVPNVVAYGDYLLFRGQYEGAMAQYTRAMELDPLSIGACHDLAIVHLVRGEYPEAESYFLKAIDLNPNWTWGYVKLALTRSRMGQCDDALQAAAGAEELLAGSGTPSTRAWLGYTYALCGEEATARAALAELRDRAATEYVDPGVYACIYLALGELDEALDAMEQSLAERSPNLVYFRAMPDLFAAELAAEPRFQTMVEAIGFR